MHKKLIINADDAGVCESVTRGICEGIDKGVITSTTVLIGLISSDDIHLLQQRQEKVSIGLHLSLTTGPAQCPALMKKQGLLRGASFSGPIPWDLLEVSAIVAEWDAQVVAFKQSFGCLPTHIDTHHHVHRNAKGFKAIVSLAKRYTIPFRRRYAHGRTSTGEEGRVVDQLVYRFNPKDAWTARKLIRFLKNMRQGVSELIVHPGYVSPRLLKVSSFTDARETELNALTSPYFFEIVREENIRLTDYRMFKR